MKNLSFDCAINPSEDGIDINESLSVTNGVSIDVTEGRSTSSIILSENDAIDFMNWLIEKYGITN